jgi:hypothetical protein
MMARDKKPVNWGVPGQTGVTEDGIPWYVPEGGPSRMDRIMQRLLRLPGTYAPVGARLVPARTAAEVKERSLRKYHDTVVAFLNEGEQIDGFIRFALDEHVPQPPRGNLEAKIGPNPLKHWWMGGGWDSMAGHLVVTIGSSRTHELNGPSVVDRCELWVRTDRRVVLMAGGMDNPLCVDAEYGLGQVGLRPDWQPGQTNGEPRRVDIAFADGSWLGLQGYDHDVPGPTEGFPERDLLAELVGAPVTASCLPAMGR